MGRVPAFILSKHYLDCIADDGRVFIGYSGTLRWRGLLLHYSSTISCCGDEKPVTRRSLHDNPPPVNTDGVLMWSLSRFGTTGTWHALAAPIEVDMIDTPRGSIRWHCTHPLADAEVMTGPGKTLKGYGYAEHLEMSLKPWELPIRELRWGRFLSAGDTVVWIDWKGSAPRTWVFHNGIRYEGGEIGDRHVRFGSYALSLSDRTVIREGAIIPGAFGKLPLPRLALPVRALAARECKWRSRGQLLHGDVLLAEGWALHEVVTL